MAGANDAVFGEFLRISGDCVAAALTTSYSHISIPDDATGVPAKSVMVQWPDGTVNAHLRISIGSIAVITSDTATPLYNYPMVLNVQGFNNISARTASGTGTLYVTPVEAG